MRVLVVAHVFYPQYWQELLTCIRNVGPDATIITFVDEASVEAARRDLPEATFLRSENRGFDIWPFLQALTTVNLNDYDVIVKLHTKRDIIRDDAYVFNHFRFNGSVWRNWLLSFCRTPQAWRRTLSLLNRSSIGMVADRHVIVRRRDLPWPPPRKCFDDAVAEVRSVAGCRAFDPSSAQYAAGTMFVVRAEPLRFLLQRGFTAESFDVSGHEREGTMLYAHVVENMFGLAVSAVGMRIEAVNGPLWWCRLYGPLLRFLFRVKETRRRRLVKVCGVTVGWRRIKPASLSHL